MISPARMRLPRLTRRGEPAVEAGARGARRRRSAVVSSPKPTSPVLEPLDGVEDEDRPRRAEGDVERHDRERQRPHRRVAPQPAEALGDLPADVRPRRLRRRRAAGRRDARDRAPRWPACTPPATTNGTTVLEGEQRGAERRAGELVDGHEPGHEPGVADGRGRAWRRPSAAASTTSCRRTSRPSRAGTWRPSTTAMSTRSATIVALSTPSTTARASVHDDDDPPPVDPVGDDAGEQAEQQPRQPLQHDGERDQERVARSADATSSGPAASAMPSPRLLTHDDASSHRNERPRRAGARTSSETGHGGRRSGGWRARPGPCRAG